MAYNEDVAARLRDALARRKGISERKMFGGLTFLMNGNMCCGVIDKNVVLRLGKEGAGKALEDFAQSSGNVFVVSHRSSLNQ